MARPAHTDPAVTRRRLLDAGRARFAAAGLHGVSTREIADEADLNLAMISYHFGDKQGLYDAVVDEVYARLAARVGRALAVSATTLEAAIAEVYRAACGERDGVRILLREVLDHGRLTARTESRHFLPGLEQTAEAAVALLGVERARARAAMVALSYLVSRYAVQEPASLKAAFEARTVEEAHAAAAASLAAAARGLLAPAPTPPAAPRSPSRKAPARAPRHDKSKEPSP